jgi:hypothetical protein
METGGRDTKGGRKTGMVARGWLMPSSSYWKSCQTVQLRINAAELVASEVVGGVRGGPNLGTAKAHDGTVSQEP